VARKLLRSDTPNAFVAEPERVSAAYIDAHSPNLVVSHLQLTWAVRGRVTGTTRPLRKLSHKIRGLFVWVVELLKDDGAETIFRL
jgi:hypothetical protein